MAFRPLVPRETHFSSKKNQKDVINIMEHDIYSLRFTGNNLLILLIEED